MRNLQASKISRKELNKVGCTLIAELCGLVMRALPRIFRLFWMPKKYLPKFRTQKNPLIIPIAWNLETPPPPLHAQMTPSKVPATKPIDSNFPLSILLLSSLRKQLTFGNATTGFPAKWRLRNEHKNPILMTHHYPDLGNASDLFVETSGGVTKCQLFFQATYFCKWCQNVHHSSVATVEWFQCKVFYI